MESLFCIAVSSTNEAGYFIILNPITIKDNTTPLSEISISDNRRYNILVAIPAPNRFIWGEDFFYILPEYLEQTFLKWRPLKKRMDVLFLEAPYRGTVELSAETLAYLKKKKYNTVGLYASIQFCNNLELVKKQLQDNNIAVITSRPDRTHAPSQLLGCDMFPRSLRLLPAELEKIDCYVYVGDGKFHPLALAYRQLACRQKDSKGDSKEPSPFKEIICADPLRKKGTIMTGKDVQKIIKKYKSSLMKFLFSRNVGVIITVKPGQEQMKPAFFLEKKFPDKKFYYFVDDLVSFNHLENFPFIDVWVNTACPRIGLDDQEQFRKGVINLNEALPAEEILRNYPSASSR